MRFSFISAGIVSLCFMGSIALGTNVYEVPYVDEVPDGVAGWKHSGLLEERQDSRFLPYDEVAAAQLVLDATADRGVARETGVPLRKTALRAAYDARGISIFIEAEEPMIRKLLDSLPDPSSPARGDAMEIFFSPALSGAQYYQIYVGMFPERVVFYDWAAPHIGSPPLKAHARVEARPTKEGAGVCLFVPWEAVPEYLPEKGGVWRFSVIRWMAFGKAGGVTWGGKVHETGRFGHLKLLPPTPEQLVKIEKRLARTAWFHFVGRAKEAAKFWSDEKLGDPEFYSQVLKPYIDGQMKLGESLGSPDDWKQEALDKVKPVRKDWLGFDYKVAELRRKFLLEKHFSQESL